MKSIIHALRWSLLVWAPAALAATAELYENTSPVVAPPQIAPQIDATAFVNRSIFSISSLTFPALPYETINTQIFTNAPSGVMDGNPGFRFHEIDGNARRPMTYWENRGSIASLSANFFILTGETANWVLVAADQVVNPGRVNTGSQGLMQFRGAQVDMANAKLRSGEPLNSGGGILLGSSVGLNSYINDVAITDVYWGRGTNQNLSGNGMRMDLTGGGGANSLLSDLSLNGPRSPLHQVLTRSFGTTFTNTVTVPLFLFSQYTAHVLTNQTGPTNFVIQVVFTPTNTFDTNFSTDVQFFPDTDNGATVVVGFHSADFDIVSQTFFTNSLYLVDATAGETNHVLARELVTRTQRPRSMEVLRTRPFVGFAVPPNANYRPSLIYTNTYLSNSVSTAYVGYQALFSAVNTPGMTSLGTPLPLTDPTNFAGRIEVEGQSLNLNRARIRAESTLIVRTPNLISNSFAQVDAPFLIYDLGSTQEVLTITNLAPATVRRPSGTISAWAGLWRNFEPAETMTPTNTVVTNINVLDFHVLIVEPNLQSLRPVVMNELRLTANHAVLGDQMSIGKSFRLDMPKFELSGGLVLPFNSSWGATNVANLFDFTNSGALSASGSIYMGSDRPSPYSNIVNRGTTSGASQFFRTRNFDNQGIIGAHSGLLSVDALTASMQGAPTSFITNTTVFSFIDLILNQTVFITNTVIFTNAIGPALLSSSDVTIKADDLVVSNSLIRAGDTFPGVLTISATNRLVDSGSAGMERWQASAGIQVVRKPVESDLMHTHFRLNVPPFETAISFWPADDMGPVASGYENNLALGQMTIDARSALSQAAFFGTVAGRGLYVDFLQFDNYATNYEAAVAVDPTLTIYFAGSNIPVEKLDGAGGGRLRWVPTFAGPNTSTNLLYPDGQTYTFNIHLASSADLDSDGDGTVNSEDPTPIPVSAPVTLAAAVGEGAQQTVQLTWNTVANTINVLEYMSVFNPNAPWQELTTIDSGPADGMLHYTDTIPAGQSQRYYRVRIEPQ